MNSLSDQEEYLIYAKITGSLNAEEEMLCEQLLQENVTARENYQRLMRKLPATDVAGHFDRLKAPGAWREHLTSTNRRSSMIRRLSLAAAAVLLLAVAGVWMYREKPSKPALAARKETGSIQLTFADGKKIDLSKTKESINSEGVLLSNSGTSLQYTASSSKTNGINQLTVPTGMDYQITLSDGTKVWLNAATQLDFPFSFTGNTREIRIDGEAYIEVAKIPGKPFIVHLPVSTVEVLGTSFNVNSYDKISEQVSLIEGAVRMQANGQAFKLQPGIAGIYKEGSGLQQTAFDTQKVLAWREGLFYFKNATVQEISRVIARWYGVSTKTDNQALLSRRFTGVLDKNQPISIFQDNLKAISGIDSYEDDKGVLHFR